MLSIFIFFFTVSCVHSTIFTERGIDNRSDARLAGSFSLSILQQAEYDELKYIAYIKVIPGNQQMGNGIIINDFWVLTVTDVVSGYTFDQVLVIICVNPAQPEGLNRIVKEIINNDADCAATPLESCVALIRVCPSITPDHFANVAPSLSAYRATSVVMNLYRHEYDSGHSTIVMLKGSKHIGEMCECMDISGWNVNKHVCLAEDATTYSETADKKSVVVTNGDRSEVIGFLIVKQTTGFGEIVLYVTAVQQFINDNALVNPYKYPI